MAQSPKSNPRGEGAERIDIRLVRDPLAFFAEDHMRQRGICAMIDQLVAGGAAEPALVAEILTHTKAELPLHMRDEDEDLFPLLRRRAMPEDDIEKTLSRLADDHETGEAMALKAVDILERLAEIGGVLPDEDRAILSAFATHERHHLIVENAIILPLARVRLTANDRQTLSLRMAARRGICLLPTVPHA